MPLLWLLPVFVAGFLHGRMFGGFMGIRGGIMRASSVLWGLPSFLLGCPIGVVLSGSSLLQWNDGHRFDRPWRVFVRYSIYTVPVWMVTSFWPVLAIGATSAACAAIFRVAGLKGIRTPFDVSDNPNTPEDETQQLLDGWEAYWEGVTRGLSAVGWVASAAFSAGPQPWAVDAGRWAAHAVTRMWVWAA